MVYDPTQHEHQMPASEDDGSTEAVKSDEGRIKTCLFVWDTGTLSWKRMEHLWQEMKRLSTTLN